MNVFWLISDYLKSNYPWENRCYNYCIKERIDDCNFRTDVFRAWSHLFKQSMPTMRYILLPIKMICSKIRVIEPTKTILEHFGDHGRTSRRLFTGHLRTVPDLIYSRTKNFQVFA